LALAKKANNVVVLDIGKISSLCDYFVICSGESSRQVKAIYEDVRRFCKTSKIKIQHYGTDDQAQWLLLDLSDVILHIFLEDVRQFYNIEELWSKAKKIKIS